VAAFAGRFADSDLASILGHLGHAEAVEELVRAAESYFVQPGTSGCE
jgi:hypothetical protein